MPEPMRQIRLLCFLIPLLSIIAVIPAKAVPDIRSGLSNLHINSIVQDREGYIWIATAKGLCRYNGYEYLHYRHDPEDPDGLPSDMIMGLYVDSEGSLWVASDRGGCLYDADRDIFREVVWAEPTLLYGFVEHGGRLMAYGMSGVKIIDRQTLEIETLPGTQPLPVRTILWDGNALWMGNYMGGEIYKHTGGETRKIREASGVDILCSYRTPSGHLWFGTNRGLLVIDPVTGEPADPHLSAAAQEQLSRLAITFFLETNRNQLLIGSENESLFVYDRPSGELMPAAASAYFTGIESRHLTCAYTDRNRNIWVGTFDRGVILKSDNPSVFNDDPALEAFTRGKFVTRVIEDRDGNYWIGTRYHGLMHYDRKSKTVTVYDRHTFAPFRKENNDLIQSLMLDSEGHIWAGYDKNLIRIRAQGNRIESYRVIEMNADIGTLTEDDRKRVWAGSATEGITLFDTALEQEPVTLPLSKRWNNITRILRLSNGEMMFSCHGENIYLVEPATLEIRTLSFPDGLGDYRGRAVTLFEDRSGKIWMGTYGWGAAWLDRKTGDFEVLTPKDGLPSNDVLAFAEDASGAIWMSTSAGLCRYRPDKKDFHNYFDTDGTGGNQYHEKCVWHSPDGKIFFGGNHGITFLDPAQLRETTEPVPVNLEDLKILNLSERPGAPKGVLSKRLTRTEAITLNHRQNVFSIDFAGIDYNTPGKIRYAYRLVPFDRDWNYVEDYRRATYSNLSPGQYRFEVMAQRAGGSWTEVPAALGIRVKAAPWLTTTAWVLYITLAFFIVLILLRFYIRIKIDREKLGLIEREHAYEQEMNEMKIRFFTNVSHELRTPLSMIYGPVKELQQGGAEPERSGYLLRLVDSNVNKLLRLIDQLMDFAKLESDTLALSVDRCDIGAIVRDAIQNYDYIAREKGLELHMHLPPTIPPVWLDRDKIEKVLSNLLSNAIKYTPSGGRIDIYIGYTDENRRPQLEIRVEDTGIGMKEEDIASLFTRHRRFTGRTGLLHSAKGKGIGLNYVKRLVTIHKGTITAQNREENGMCFRVVVPAGENAYPVSERTAESAGHPEVQLSRIEAGTIPMAPQEAAHPSSTDRPAIVVAEDDPGLRSFLVDLLAADYRVFGAENGKEALDHCRKENIDLVVSDVLMPELDGYQLCAQIKEDPDLCHIPVVLLTAKTLDEHQIEGYRAGADAYLRKPFNPDVLRELLSNLFRNVEIRRSALVRGGISGIDDPETAGEAPAEEATALGLHPLDRKFLEKLYARIDRDLSDNQLSISQLGEDMAFSRTGFYRKIKGLTGYAPNDFLRIYRLNRAAELLAGRVYTVSEVVDMTGFGTHSHFSHSFKKQYGISPKEFRNTGRMPDPKIPPTG